MPIYEYRSLSDENGCASCRSGFELLQHLADPPLAICPQCGGPVRKAISAASIGASKSGFDTRAKAAGFHKLQKLGKGEYEKKY